MENSNQVCIWTSSTKYKKLQFTKYLIFDFRVKFLSLTVQKKTRAYGRKMS